MRVVDTSAWIEWLIGSPPPRTLMKEFPEKRITFAGVSTTLALRLEPGYKTTINTQDRKGTLTVPI